MTIKERISQAKQKIVKLKGQRNILTKVQVFKFQPFSRRQKQILTWWAPDSPVKDYDGIIADGAIRSGKTVCMSLSFVMWAMATFSGQNFAMCGKTIGSFRRNVLFWLKLMLKSRGYRVMDHRADNLVEISRGAACFAMRLPSCRRASSTRRLADALWQDQSTGLTVTRTVPTTGSKSTGSTRPSDISVRPGRPGSERRQRPPGQIQD